MNKQTGFIVKKVRESLLGNKKSKNGNFMEFDCKDLHFENIYLDTRDGVKIGCWILGPKEIDYETICIIVLHGNECNRAEFTEKYNIKRLAELNYILFIPDYRSFGDSEGEFWIDTVNFDIDAVYNFCIARFQQNPHFIGHSLGCAVVLEFLKFSNHLNKMVLLSPFTTTIEIINTQISWQLVKVFFVDAEEEIKGVFNYDNVENIKYADASKVLIFHGTADTIVPYEQGKKLADVIDCFFVTLDDYDHDTLFYEGNALHKIDWFIRD
ncbi:hypothetical protein BDAP_001442 [Binucleata daphniae]